MMKEHHLTVPADIEHVDKACQFVADVSAQIGMSDDLVHRCYLSMEEICTNIIEHGYRYDGKNQVIDIFCRAYDNRLTIVIQDDAEQFNPLERADPDPTAPLDQRQGGGWGIFFIKKFMDRVDYRYNANRNQLTVEKFF